MKHINIILKTTIIFTLIACGIALECYVCTRQEHNTEKCLNTIKTCEQGEDMCLSEVLWKSTPYWDQGAAKQFYVSKRCATKAKCEESRALTMPYCSHIWYEDWKCSECCQGDRCNYYVILGGSTARGSALILTAGIAAVFTAWRLVVA